MSAGVQDYFESLPHKVAVRQRSWDRLAAALRARRSGLKYREIGTRFGVSLERARQMVVKAERLERAIQRGEWRCPIEYYADERPDFTKLSDAIGRQTIAEKRDHLRGEVAMHIGFLQFEHDRLMRWMRRGNLSMATDKDRRLLVAAVNFARKACSL